ncbi:heavy-metal-associated domain-containing protein [Flavobacterium caseinilyticum]|uniref:Copper chaperone n=1 Tax=Flavobacterium caseinilyticum TaxID=2541732 RepID=A0A4R5AZG2_9FLAO|nr:heavy-metal-associated domain-containing protein [Flavobacterium caseinilyticum]TDD78631.1 copper chaperone [Flavobacterium caseinilyticum]
MKHTYSIEGMSCDGCRSKVEKTLNSIAGVAAIVSLIPPMATITMDQHIATTQLQEALTAEGNYTIAFNEQADARGTIEEPIEKSCCNAVKQEDKTVQKSCCSATDS